MHAEILQVRSHLGNRRPRAQDIDQHIGSRLRQRRVMVGLTQQKMAELIGVTYQQAHKYENGVNRVSAARLYLIAQVLGVEVAFFYEGLQNDPRRDPEPQQRVFLDLARNFRSIRLRKHQDAICQLTRILAKLDQDDEEDAWRAEPELAASA